MNVNNELSSRPSIRLAPSKDNGEVMRALLSDAPLPDHIIQRMADPHAFGVVNTSHRTTYHHHSQNQRTTPPAAAVMANPLKIASHQPADAFVIPPQAEERIVSARRRWSKTTRSHHWHTSSVLPSDSSEAAWPGNQTSTGHTAAAAANDNEIGPGSNNHGWYRSYATTESDDGNGDEEDEDEDEDEEAMGGANGRVEKQAEGGTNSWEKDVEESYELEEDYTNEGEGEEEDDEDEDDVDDQEEESAGVVRATSATTAARRHAFQHSSRSAEHPNTLFFAPGKGYRRSGTVEEPQDVDGDVDTPSSAARAARAAPGAAAGGAGATGDWRRNRELLDDRMRARRERIAEGNRILATKRLERQTLMQGETSSTSSRPSSSRRASSSSASSMLGGQGARGGSFPHGAGHRGSLTSAFPSAATPAGKRGRTNPHVGSVPAAGARGGGRHNQYDTAYITAEEALRYAHHSGNVPAQVSRGRHSFGASHVGSMSRDQPSSAPAVAVTAAQRVQEELESRREAARRTQQSRATESRTREFLRQLRNGGAHQDHSMTPSSAQEDEGERESQGRGEGDGDREGNGAAYSVGRASDNCGGNDDDTNVDNLPRRRARRSDHDRTADSYYTREQVRGGMRNRRDSGNGQGGRDAGRGDDGYGYDLADADDDEHYDCVDVNSSNRRRSSGDVDHVDSDVSEDSLDGKPRALSRSRVRYARDRPRERGGVPTDDDDDFDVDVDADGSLAPLSSRGRGAVSRQRSLFEEDKDIQNALRYLERVRVRPPTLAHPYPFSSSTHGTSVPATACTSYNDAATAKTQQQQQQQQRQHGGLDTSLLSSSSSSSSSSLAIGSLHVRVARFLGERGGSATL